jgi:hypothetical protein
MRRRESDRRDSAVEVWLMEGHSVMLRVSKRLDSFTRSGEGDDVVGSGVPVPGCVRPTEDELGNGMSDLRDLLSRPEGGIDDDVKSSVTERQLVLGHGISVPHAYDIDASSCARWLQ